MIRINLLPPEITQKRKDEKRWQWIALGAVGVVVALGLVVVFLQVQVSGKQQEVAMIEQQAANMRESSARFKVFQQKQSDLQVRQALVETALKDRVDWSRLYGDLSLVVPADVYLTKVTGAEPKPEVAQDAKGKKAKSGDAGGALTIEGKALDHPDDVPDLGYKSLAKMMVRLAELKLLNDVWMTESYKTEPKDLRSDASFIEFKISAKVANADGAVVAASNVPPPPSK